MKALHYMCLVWSTGLIQMKTSWLVFICINPVLQTRFRYKEYLPPALKLIAECLSAMLTLKTTSRIVAYKIPFLIERMGHGILCELSY